MIDSNSSFQQLIDALETLPPKAQQALSWMSQNRQLVEEALKKAGRTDLIGYGRHCLIRPEKGDAPYRQTAQKAASGPGKPARPAKKKTIRNIHKKKTP